MILLHPNHPYSSNPIPPKLNLHLSPSSEFGKFTGSKRKPREYRHRMKIFNILLASKAVFGAEKCHLPVSICIQNFLFCTISNFATFGPSTFELWDRPVKKSGAIYFKDGLLFGIVNLLLRPYTLSLCDRPVCVKKDFLL